MSAQPEALRLADALEKYWGAESGHDRERQAAAELRRLHSEVEKKSKPWIGLTTDEVLDCAKDFEGRLPEGWMKIVESVNTRLQEKNK